jgi:hypothetical protein
MAAEQEQAEGAPRRLKGEAAGAHRCTGGECCVGWWQPHVACGWWLAADG